MNFQGQSLSVQMQGEDVQILHRELSKLGYSISPEEIEKKLFGEATLNAVLDFQQRRGLEATGVVDEHIAQQISAAVEALQPLPKRLSVVGQVVGQDGKPLHVATVKVFDKALRSEELLGEATTDDNGQYEITYTDDQLSRSDKKKVDLLVRVFSPEGIQLVESEILFNAPEEATVDLVVEPHEVSTLSEYEQLLTQLQSTLGDVPLADVTDEDVAFVAGNTGIDRQRIELLRQGAELSRETRLPAEVFYAFARQNLSVRLDDLLIQDPHALSNALQNAIQDHLIPTQSTESLDEQMKRIEELAIVHAFRVTQEFVGQLLNQQTGEPLVGFAVHGFALDIGAEPIDLGQDITNAQGLFGLAYPVSQKSVSEEHGAAGE